MFLVTVLLERLLNPDALGSTRFTASNCATSVRS